MKRPCEETTSESDMDETIDVGSENNYSGQSTSSVIRSNSPTTTSQIMARKKRRGIIEKRRRDRINNSLSELRRLVPTAFEKQGSAKLEKAEILQMTVDHLKMLQATGGKGYFDAHGPCHGLHEHWIPGVLNRSGEVPELRGRPGLLRPAARAPGLASQLVRLAAGGGGHDLLPGPPPSPPASSPLGGGLPPPPCSPAPTQRTPRLGVHALSPFHHFGSASCPWLRPPHRHVCPRGFRPADALDGQRRPLCAASLHLSAVPLRHCPRGRGSGHRSCAQLPSVLCWGIPHAPPKRSCRRGSCNSHQPALVGISHIQPSADRQWNKQ